MLSPEELEERKKIWAKEDALEEQRRKGEITQAEYIIKLKEVQQEMRNWNDDLDRKRGRDRDSPSIG
jgi:hypothetical protein